MAIRKIRLGGEQLGRIQKKHAERAFDEKSIPEPKIDTTGLPLIPIVAGERSKFISHRLGYYPNIGVREESGSIVQVGVNHISDQECEITWQGDLTGVVIIDY